MRKGCLTKPHRTWLFFLFFMVLIAGWCFTIQAATPADAAAGIRLACSAQVFEALRDQGLESFTAQTGIQVETRIYPSASAVKRLVNGLCDVAATADELSAAHRAAGFEQHPFCRDALVIVTGVKSGIRNLDMALIRAVFSGAISNWSQLGGPDHPITLIIPATNTAAYRAFRCRVMQGREIAWHIMTASSTAAGEITRKFPWSISFVSQGATRGRPGGTRVIKVAGLGPEEPRYPFHATFSLVTRGEPKGEVKQFLDFVYSGSMRDLITERGMTPLQRP